MANSRPLIVETLQILTYAGLNPFKKVTIWSFLAEKMFILLVFGPIIDAATYLMFKNKESRNFNDTHEAFVVFASIQSLSKLLMFVFGKQKFKVLIEKVNLFWKLDEYGKGQQKENEKTFSMSKYYQHFVKIMSLVLVPFFLAMPLLNWQGKVLPYHSKMCTSQEYPYYHLCYLFQVVSVYGVLPGQIGFDMMYLALITNIVCELRLIKRGFENITINPKIRKTDQSTMDEVRKLIDHHNLILECIRLTKDTYKRPFLLLLVLDTFCMSFCSALIVIASANSDVDNGTLGILYKGLFGYYSVQLFVYCVPATILTQECEKVGNAIYSSRWWIKTQPEFRNAVVMIIARSSQQEVLTAGDLFHINLETYTQVMKGTYSFYTILQASYSE